MEFHAAAVFSEGCRIHCRDKCTLIVRAILDDDCWIASNRPDESECESTTLWCCESFNDLCLEFLDQSVPQIVIQDGLVREYTAILGNDAAPELIPDLKSFRGCRIEEFPKVEELGVWL